MFIYDSQDTALCVQNYPTISFSLTSLKPVEFSMGFCVFGSLFTGLWLNPIVQVAQTTLFYTPTFQGSVTQLQPLIF